MKRWCFSFLFLIEVLSVNINLQVSFYFFMFFRSDHFYLLTKCISLHEYTSRSSLFCFISLFLDCGKALFSRMLMNKYCLNYFYLYFTKLYCTSILISEKSELFVEFCIQIVNIEILHFIKVQIRSTKFHQ